MAIKTLKSPSDCLFRIPIAQASELPSPTFDAPWRQRIVDPVCPEPAHRSEGQSGGTVGQDLRRRSARLASPANPGCSLEEAALSLFVNGSCWRSQAFGRRTCMAN